MSRFSKDGAQGFAAPYEAQAVLSRDAFLRPQLWRLALGVVLACAVILLCGLAWSFLVACWGVELVGAGPQYMLALLYFFGAMTLGVLVAARIMQGRGWRGVLGWPIRSSAMATLRYVAPLYLVYTLLPMPEGLQLQRSDLPMGTWAALLPLAALGFLVQVSAEEIAFRGYLQSQLAARFRSKWIWMVLPSALFGALHYNPDAGSTVWLIMLWAALFGLIAADLTARSGSLGPAIAFHFTHNIGLLYASPQDDLAALSLYVVPVELSDTAQIWPLMGLEVIVVALAWIAARIGIKR